MTHSGFDPEAWIERLAAALEHVAAEARPSFYPIPTHAGGYGSSEERWSDLRGQYRALAARANHDPTASIQFRESYLRLNEHPVEAVGILREHPGMKPGLEGSGSDESVRFRVLGKSFRSYLSGLAGRLTKLSFREGGQEAARRVDAYLTAGAKGTVPAHEITVVHGVVVKARFNLYAGAYLAPYGYAKTEFDLPDEPEPLREMSFPDAAVLVRGLEYGPGVALPDDDAGLPDLQVAYRFPTHYHVDLDGWFDDSRLLVDLLSIVARVPLLSRTRYVRVAKWIEDIDPNFASGVNDSHGYVSDVWPQGRHLSDGDVDAFLAMARGWRMGSDSVGAMNLAIRRVAGSFSRPGGRFGREDRILDVAIALEVLYGGTTGHKLSQRAAGLLGTTLTQQTRTYEQAMGFYGARNRIVHWKKPASSPDALDAELGAGRNLACLTLASLLERNTLPKWADVMKNLLPETRAHIKEARSRRDK